jgi:GntR family transcriptional regulator, rspAB operon transcriptional repressor
MPMGKKITRSRTENVYFYIKEKIIYGEYSPGELLNEGALAIQLDVSKTPVREALNGLRHEGLVEVIPYKGYFVKKLSIKEIKDLFELRIVLETKTAELATLKANHQQITSLKELASKRLNENDLENAKKSFLKINENFHTYLGLIAGNDQITNSITSIINQLQPVLFHDVTESSVTRMFEEHLDLVNAIGERDVNLAREVMLQQLQDSQMRIMTQFNT